MRTVGRRITDVTPPQGFSAETSAAATILISSSFGFPLSTTQVTSGAVVGSGIGKRLAAVRWGVVGRIAVAWIITLPAAALVGGLGAWAAGTGTVGLVLVVIAGIALCIAMWMLARRRPVTAATVNEESLAADSLNGRAPRPEVKVTA